MANTSTSQRSTDTSLLSLPNPGCTLQRHQRLHYELMKRYDCMQMPPHHCCITTTCWTTLQPQHSLSIITTHPHHVDNHVLACVAWQHHLMSEQHADGYLYLAVFMLMGTFLLLSSASGRQ